MYKQYEKLLQERGLTSYKVSQATGIGESVFSMWKSRSEEGKVGISLPNLIKVAEFFDVPLDYFREGSD